MMRPLANPAYFACASIEAGALARPNVFELSSDALHRRLTPAGKLIRPAD